MNPPLFRVVLGSIAIIAVALFLWGRLTDSKLQKEFMALDHRQREAIRLRRENRDLAVEASQLTALRLRAQQAVREQRSAQLTESVLLPGFASIDELKNAGVGSPEKAFETFVWATTRGETATLARLLIVSGAARAEIKASFAELSADERMMHGPTENLFALLYLYANPVFFTAVQTVGESAVDPNQVILNIKRQFPAGQIRAHAIPFYKTTNGWKVIVSDSQVASILQKKGRKEEVEEK